MQPIYWIIIIIVIIIMGIALLLYKFGFRFTELSLSGPTLVREPSDKKAIEPVAPAEQTTVQNDLVHGDKVLHDKVLRDKITVETLVIQADTRDKDAIHLPALAAIFTGRVEQLADIGKNFAAGSDSIVLTQTISGLGGVGKTQVALAYAHAHKSNYDIIWVLQADDVALLTDGLRALGLALGLDVARLDANGVRTTVLSHLGTSKKDILLIYDNADVIEPSVLRDYLPVGCHLLITSRRAAAQWGSVAAQTVTLGVFSREEGMAFWARRLAHDPEVGLLPKAGLPDGEKARLLELGETLGWLPLAMEQAAAFMLKRKKSVAAYLAQFNERREGLWKRETAPDDYQATVATTWAMAFEHAQETTGAAELLNLCCFFAPDEIPLAVMVDGADRLPAPLATVMADEDEREDALEALTAYSLLTVVDGKANMHRLVQDVARRGMGEGERGSGGAGAVWVKAAMKVLSKAYNFDPHDMETWAACGGLLPHVKVAVDLAAGLGVESTEAGRLNNEAGFYLYNYGDYAGAKPFYERALAIKEAQSDPDYPSIATSLNNLGLLLQAMGKYEEALPFFTRALAIDEKALGLNHPDTAIGLNNMGALLESMGEYEEARPFYTRALAIDEKALGPDHPDTAIDLNNIGALLESMGKYEEARPFHTRALAITEKQLAPNHPNVARSLNNMGSLLQSMGKYEEALPFYTRALAIFEKQLGSDHPNIATLNNNMGALLKSMGEYEEAWPFYTRALAIRIKALGSDHPDTAIDLNNLGGLLQVTGKYEEARPFYTRALAIFEKQLGSDHPHTAQGYNNLAVLSAYEGDMQTAIPLMRQALAIFEKALGDNHPNTQQVRESLAAIEAAASA